MDLLDEFPFARHGFAGVTTGLVTNNKDPEDLGRVKVRFPWLSDKEETRWARVLTPMAGRGRGLYILPEVDDEVLVAFEHGDMNFPYVLGALWNGKDKPPGSNKDGKNNFRTLKSRSGHVITLDDTEGKEKIIVRDKTEKNEIVVDSQKNSLTVKVDGDLTIESRGAITVKSSGGDIRIECRNLAVETKQNCEIKASGNFTVQANGQLAVKGSDVTVQANAQLALRGSNGVMVNDGALEVK